MSDEMSAEAVAALNQYAASGNNEAKSVLTELGMDLPPAKTEEPKKPVESAPVEVVPEAPKPTETPAAKADEGRARNERADKKPTKLDTIRDLRRKRRELESALDAREQEFQKKISDLETRLESLSQNGQKPTPSEDDLSALLEKPGEYLSKREERLLQKMQKMLEQTQAKLPTIMLRQNEKEQARKALESLDGFDLEENEDDLMDLFSEYGLDEDDFYDMAENKPMKFARMAEKVWGKRNDLPPKEIAAKGAAASSAAIAGKAPVGAKPTVKELNELYASAMKRGDDKAAEGYMRDIEAQLQ